MQFHELQLDFKNQGHLLSHNNSPRLKTVLYQSKQGLTILTLQGILSF